MSLFLFFGALVWLILGLADSGSRGRWYPLHLILQAGAVAAAATGLWRMRKWGVVILGTTFAAIQVLYAVTGLLNMETFLIYALCFGPAAYFYSRMK